MRGTIRMDVQTEGIGVSIDIKEVNISDKMSLVLSLMQALQFDVVDITILQSILTGRLSAPIDLKVKSGSGELIDMDKSALKILYEFVATQEEI